MDSTTLIDNHHIHEVNLIFILTNNFTNNL